MAAALWLIGAILLAVAEVAAGEFTLLMLGGGALVTAGATGIFDLPLWAQGFYLQVPLDSQRMLYRDLATEDKLGLTMELKIPETDAAQEKLLRQALEKQFRVAAGALKKQGFTPRPRSDGKPLKGQQWVFEVKPQEADDSKTAPAQRMVFWIVDQGSSRAILRAAVATPEQEQRAQQLAQALGW